MGRHAMLRDRDRRRMRDRLRDLPEPVDVATRVRVVVTSEDGLRYADVTLITALAAAPGQAPALDQIGEALSVLVRSLRHHASFVAERDALDRAMAGQPGEGEV